MHRLRNKWYVWASPGTSADANPCQRASTGTSIILAKDMNTYTLIFLLYRHFNNTNTLWDMGCNHSNIAYCLAQISCELGCSQCFFKDLLLAFYAFILIWNMMWERMEGWDQKRSASRDSNSGHPKCNGATCRHADHKAIGTNSQCFFLMRFKNDIKVSETLMPRSLNMTVCSFFRVLVQVKVTDLSAPFTVTAICLTPSWDNTLNRSNFIQWAGFFKRRVATNTKAGGRPSGKISLWGTPSEGQTSLNFPTTTIYIILTQF